ncbi:kinase-like domain-containing protein [Rhizophagus diaphanus]|nr:kinase-like domain-containing protein [Rhizophagus diaphanus] [Rhizophagus sp. MUCL 43196]
MEETGLKEPNYYINWLEKSIADEYLNYYEYSEFKNLKPIGNGSFGSVIRANWKNSGNFFALKTFKNNCNTTLKELVNEIRLQKRVDFHENIIRFYGVTKVDNEKYSLVLEYANNGTLKTYLNEHFNELTWTDKYQLAFQLATAVECLHDCNIIHRDLHSDNILVHQKNLKLTDFGLSKKIAEVSSNVSNILGVIPFIDPKKLNDQGYKLNKKSDVYGIGVLMWQISSGRQPFFDYNYDVSLILSIANGKREEIIDNTPKEYSNLYTECWKYEPDERPNVQNVVSILYTLIFPKQDDIIIDTVNKEKENNQIESIGTMDLNNELMSNTGLNLMDTEKNLSNTTIQTNSSIFSYESTFDKVNNIVVENLIEEINSKHDREGINFQNIKQFINQQVLELNQSLDNLIIWLSNQVNPQYVYLLGLLYYYNIGTDEDSTKAFELFLKASENNYSFAQVYLGKCYNDGGYGIECNHNLAFNWFQKSAESGNVIAKFYLGNCYEFGIGIAQNTIKSVYWYQKAANNGNTSAKFNFENGKKVFGLIKDLAEKGDINFQFKLGYCYDEGIGTEINKLKAFEMYKAAAEKGYTIAQYNLGLLYQFGEGVDKNEKKAFELMKDLAGKGDVLDAQSLLGYYYSYGIGIDRDIKKALYWYQKAAENGSKVAQHNLGEWYELGIGVNKDENKAFEFYKKSAENGYIDAKFILGYYYVNGIGTEINKEKGFELYNEATGTNIQINHIKNDNEIVNDLDKFNYWYHKAAENDNNIALYNLGEFYELGKGISKNETRAFEFYKKSADQGYINAQYKVGYIYNYGTQIIIDKEKAFNYFTMAAKGGNVDAQYNLASLYERGEGTEKNIDNAIYWYKKAAENGCQEAEKGLNLLFK